TNRDMVSMLMDGVFREDLIHRFHKNIRIPPLRERQADILPLANYLINELVRKEIIKRRPDLSVSAERALTSYGYPGNVRELEKIIFNAAVHACAEKSPIIEGVKVDEAIVASGWRRPEAEYATNEGMQTALSLQAREIEAVDDPRTRDVLKALRQHNW